MHHEGRLWLSALLGAVFRSAIINTYRVNCCRAARREGGTEGHLNSLDPADRT